MQRALYRAQVYVLVVISTLLLMMMMMMMMVMIIMMSMMMTMVVMITTELIIFRFAYLIFGKTLNKKIAAVNIGNCGIP